MEYSQADKDGGQNLVHRDVQSADGRKGGTKGAEKEENGRRGTKIVFSFSFILLTEKTTISEL